MLLALTAAQSDATATAAANASKDRGEYEYTRQDCWRPLDGKQRSPTELEKETYRLWLTKEIYLDSPPVFAYETRTLHERNLDASILSDRLCHKLYARLPRGGGARAKHYVSVLSCVARGGCKLGRIAALMADVTGLTFSAHSQVAEFTFLAPFARDMWADTTFRFSRGAFVLRATGSLTAGNGEKGFDPIGLSMLYRVEVLGSSNTSAQTICDWFCVLTSTPVLCVEAFANKGSTLYDPHVWQVIFASTECPPDLLEK